MSSIVEALSGIMRLFPNTMLITLFVVGMATSKFAWILIALGGLLTGILTMMLQYMSGKLPWNSSDGIPGEDILAACSIVPNVKGASFSYAPSMWTSMSAFFLSFIFINAFNVYSAPPGHGSKKDVIPVQQRKGIGLISMLSVIVLGIFLLVARYHTNCETPLGMFFGAITGIGSAYAWWLLVALCGAKIYPDIHGVMIGLGPAHLRPEKPVICMKK